MSSPLTDKVIISGIGQSDIGRRLGRDPLELTAEACVAAVQDAGLTLADIDAMVIPRNTKLFEHDVHFLPVWRGQGIGFDRLGLGGHDVVPLL